jgi:hypothetical protein
MSGRAKGLFLAPAGGAGATEAVATALSGSDAVNDANDAAITSASVSPTGSALLVAAGRVNGNDSTSFTMSDTFGGLTWTVEQLSFLSGVANGGTAFLAWAQLPSSPGSGTVTLTLGANRTGKCIALTEITGHDPSNPIRGKSTNPTTPTRFVSPNQAFPYDCVVGAVSHNDATNATTGVGTASFNLFAESNNRRVTISRTPGASLTAGGTGVLVLCSYGSVTNGSALGVQFRGNGA